MRVRLKGTTADGASQTLDWNLVAENNHGPEIPCTPAIVLTNKLVRGEITRRGAQPCLGMFSMGELLEELSIFDIRSSENVIA